MQPERDVSANMLNLIMYAKMTEDDWKVRRAACSIYAPGLVSCIDGWNDLFKRLECSSYQNIVVGVSDIPAQFIMVSLLRCSFSVKEMGAWI
jgi:hypothetical protein